MHLCRAIILAFGIASSAVAATQSLKDGVAGVPWSGSRDQFRQAIPGLTCAPARCWGHWSFHGIPGDIELWWGGLSPVVTSSIFKFSRDALPDMKMLLRRELGRPARQYIEDGESVTEWKGRGVLIDLYHGSRRDLPQIYVEPKRRK